MSTLGKGISISSILPWISVILSDMPLTATISRALKMMVDMSTPITCFAPALTANLTTIHVRFCSQETYNRMGVEQAHCLHGQDGRSAADIEDDLVLEDVGVLSDGVHVRPSADLIFLVTMSASIPTTFSRRKLTSISSWMPWWL